MRKKLEDEVDTTLSLMRSLSHRVPIVIDKLTEPARSHLLRARVVGLRQ